VPASDESCALLGEELVPKPSGEVERKGTTSGIVRGWLFLGLALLTLSLLLGSVPSTAQTQREKKDPDYPQLFHDIAQLLQLHYLDLDRLTPRPLMEKAFAAIENAADEIYVENSDPGNPYLALHVDSKVQVFNLNSVETLDDAVKMLETVFDFLKRNYHGDTSLNEVRYAAANGFLSGLDPHTIVFSPEAFRDFSVHIEGEIYGVGMYVGTREGKLTVIEVLKETPAFKAGFKKQDQITKIGDESTINMTVNEAVDKIRGPLKSLVKLTIKRPAKEDPAKLETLVIPVERNRVVIKSVESALIKDWNPEGASLESQGPWKGGVGYAKVINFDKNTTSSLKDNLDRLKEQNGGKPLSGLILDLRDNSGGLLAQAIEMCDLFLSSGDIVITASRGEKLNTTDAEQEGGEPEYPIVVLANESSASGAEIVIGALQKNNRAIVLGTRSFGKGSVQQLHKLRNEAQLKVTVSEYLIPGKISIQENGVVPNIQAQAVILGGDGDYDLFQNERSMTEKNYERHIVSRYAKKEHPSYTLQYLFDPPKDDPYNDRFMSGDLEPEKDKLVQMALSLLKLAEKPFRPNEILEGKRADIERLKEKLFGEIVQKLKDKGIDWSLEGPAGSADGTKLELALSTEKIKEPSGDKEDPIPVNKLLVKASLTNKGDRPVYRMKGLTQSDYFLYKDHEFLFGKVGPGETAERSVKIKLPYFPYSRNDLFTVSLSSTSELLAPENQEPDKVVLSKSIPVEFQDGGRPSFAYSAELLDAKDHKALASLEAGTEALFKVKIKNTGTAPAYKGVTVLRNETVDRKLIFLQKGRIEFPTLNPQGETEVEFDFEVHEGMPEDNYQFELAVFDPYSNASLSRKLFIPTKEKEEATPFPNGASFSPPEIAAQLLDPETQKPVVTTTRDSLKLEALIKSQETDPFKAWVYNSSVGDHEAAPDKIYFADSQGDSKLKIATYVPLRKGINLLTVVTNDKNGLESRQNIVVRRE
jgi:carboxyl-terminal processing protease